MIELSITVISRSLSYSLEYYLNLIDKNAKGIKRLKRLMPLKKCLFLCCKEHANLV